VAILILPVLFALIYFGLRKNKRLEQNDSLLITLTNRAVLLNYLSLLALPLTAIAVYAAALTMNLQWQTNWILYLITTPLGFILFGMSLVKIWRTP
jgi:hypothetical protein